MHLSAQDFPSGLPLKGFHSGSPWITPSAIAVYVGCMCDPVISIGVLCLSHNNSVSYSWCIYYWRYCTTCRYQTTATSWELRLWLQEPDWLCTVLCSSLNMCLQQVSLISGFRSLVSMTSSGAPCFNVADSWNGPIFWDCSVLQYLLENFDTCSKVNESWRIHCLLTCFKLSGRLGSTGVQYTMGKLGSTSIQWGNWCYFTWCLACERLIYF